jgi:hypothetical protein
MKSHPNSFIPLWFKALLITLAAFLLLYFSIGICSAANDDIAMSFIADGTFTGQPDYHLVFINVIYGYMLTVFYQMIPSWEWHFVFLLLLQLVAFAFLTYHYLARYPKKYGLAALLLALFYYANTNLQFTITTIMLGIAGLLCFMEYRHKKGLWLAAFFLLSSAIIRFEAFAMILLVAAPFVLINYWYYIKQNTKFITLIIVLIGSAKGIDYMAYQSPDWQAYLTYNKLRGALNDNKSMMALANKPTALAELKLSQPEVELFNKFIYPKVFTTAKLRQINQHLKSNISLTGVLGNIWKNNLRYMPLLLMLCIVLIQQWRQKKYGITLTIIGCFIIFISISVFGLNKPYIALTSLVFIVLLINYHWLGNKWALRSINIITCVAVLWANRHSYVFNNDTVPNLSHQTLPKFHISPFCILGAGDKIDPFRIDVLRKNNIIAGGWVTNSPIYKAQLRNMGFQIDAEHFSVLDSPQLNTILVIDNSSTDYMTKLVENHLKQPLVFIEEKDVCKIYKTK